MRSRREIPRFTSCNVLITLTPAFGMNHTVHTFGGIFYLALPDGALPPIKGEGTTLPSLGMNHTAHALTGGDKRECEIMG